MAAVHHLATHQTTDELPIQGILNLNKPAGRTSHDVVARIRRLTGQRKVGHTGTLDPMATGVLVLCLGQATRLVEYMSTGTKQYRATIRLGIATDTYDGDGRVTRYTPTFRLSFDEINNAVAAWRGPVLQIPPPYSALSRDGQRLYRLARQGQPVVAEPRPVVFNDIEILDWRAPLLTLRVACSPGTYIRSLAHDIGAALDVGGHLAGLIRLASGRWRLEDALCLADFERAVSQGTWQRHLQPMDAAVSHIPAVHLSPAEAEHTRQGRPVYLPLAPAADLLRAYAPTGYLLAILRAGNAPGLWQPHKVFHG